MALVAPLVLLLKLLTATGGDDSTGASGETGATGEDEENGRSSTGSTGNAKGLEATMRFSEARHTLLTALNDKQEAEAGVKSLQLAMKKLSERVDKLTDEVAEKEAEHSASRQELFVSVRNFMTASRKLRNAKLAKEKFASNCSSGSGCIEGEKANASTYVEAAKAKRSTQRRSWRNKRKLEKYQRMLELADVDLKQQKFKLSLQICLQSRADWEKLGALETELNDEQLERYCCKCKYGEACR